MSGSPAHTRNRWPFQVFFLLGCLLLTAVSALCEDSAAGRKLKVLLVGDSTTIGSLPRQVNPEGPHLEQMIEQLAAAEGLPALDVINTGKGGETAKRLLGSKWYDQKIAPISGVDYIFVRLGINDWFRCEDLKTEFPVQLKAVIDRLREDHPDAVIIPSTICRFMPHEECVQVNALIRQVARNESLALFDLYTPYQQYLLDTGENNLNVRQPPLSIIPKKYHAWLKPHTHFQKGWGGRPDQLVVRVNDTSLDPVFGHIKGWYYDRHPNTAGYNLIAVETVRYLGPVLRERAAKE